VIGIAGLMADDLIGGHVGFSMSLEVLTLVWFVSGWCGRFPWPPWQLGLARFARKHGWYGMYAFGEG
jgi:sugar phosphate permease